MRRSALDNLQQGVTAGEMRVGNIHSETHAAWNAIHRARKNVADADCCDRVDRPARARGILDSQDQFGCRAEGIPAIRHQDASRMAACAFDQYAKACWSCDLLDHS